MKLPIAVCSLLLVGCTADAPDIHGIWRDDATDRLLEFKEDGAFIARGPGDRAEGRTWRRDVDRLIIAGRDTFIITELTADRLELDGKFRDYSLTRFDDTETLILKLRETEQRLRNFERSTKLYGSQVKHLQAERDSLQRELEHARAELDSLRRESDR